MKTTKLLACGAVLIGAASFLPAMAGDAKECDHKHHAGKWADHKTLGTGFGGGDLRHMSRALDLTDEQKDTLKAQREASRAEREVLHDQVVDAREALQLAVTAGANEAELTALAENLGKLHAQQALAGAKAHQAFLAVLSEEQKGKLNEIKTKRMEHRADKKETRPL